MLCYIAACIIGFLFNGGRTMIKTTYMMTKEILMMLKDAEKRTGWSMVDLIIAVMRSAMRHHAKYEREHGRIAYQKRLDNEGMPIPKVRVKVKFLEREYDYFNDMRRFFRRSISHVIAIAVLEYLPELVERIESGAYDDEVDSYPYKNCAIYDKCIEEATVFHIWWGLPSDPALLAAEFAR